MTTATKTKMSKELADYLKEFPREERGRYSQDMQIMMEIVEAGLRGDNDLVHEWSKKRPIHPTAPMTLKRLYGKDAVLATGWDLSRANAEYGEGWLDAPNEQY